MPTISIFYGIVIQMVWADHAPPHFHALYTEHEALIGIRTLDVMRGQPAPASTRARPRMGDAASRRIGGGLDAMRVHATAEEDRAPGLTPSSPWRVADVQALPGYRLRVRFLDGTEGEVLLTGLVERSGEGVFARLRDEALFRKAYVELGVVTWPGNLDLAPDAMYDAIRAIETWAP